MNRYYQVFNLYCIKMNIAHSPTRDAFPLSTNKILKKTFVSSLACFILLGIAAGILISVTQLGEGIPSVSVLAIVGWFIVILGFIVFLTYLYQRWYFAVYYYDLGENYIVIKKGPITPHEITIPYERVQDVYVDQDIWDRIFGIYDVHLSSATASSGMEAHIDGVGRAAADGLRENLLSTVHQKLNKKHVQPTVTNNNQ